MTDLFQIKSKKYLNAWDGGGAIKVSGRWHFKGMKIEYTSNTFSLAQLEILGQNRKISPEVHYTKTAIKEEVLTEFLDIKKLPREWNKPVLDEKSHGDMVNLTREWLSKSKSLLLGVPSVHSPHEYNFLVNVEHDLIKKIKAASKKLEHRIDHRIMLRAERFDPQNVENVFRKLKLI